MDWRAEPERRRDWGTVRWRSEPRGAYDEGKEWEEPTWDAWDQPSRHQWQETWQTDWDTSWRSTSADYEGDARRSWQGEKGAGRGRAKGCGKSSCDDSPGGKGGSGISRLHVANLPRNMAEDSLRAMFQPFGTVLGVKILATRGSGVASAIVRYSTSIAAEAAVASLNGKHDRFGGSTLEVKLARPNPKWEA